MRDSFTDHFFNVYIGTFTCTGVYLAAYLAFLAPDPMDLTFGLMSGIRGVFSFFVFLLPAIYGARYALALPWSRKLLYWPQYDIPKRLRLLHLLAALFRDGFCILSVAAIMGLILPPLFLPLESATFVPLEYVRNTALAVFMAGFLGSLVPVVFRSVCRSKKTAPLLCCLCVCLMAGCASRGSGGSFASFVGDLPEGGAVEAIASDASAKIAELYPPGHTSILLLTAKEDADNDFSSAFGNALRRSGFTLVPGPAENAVAVAYLMDGFVEEKKGGVKVWYLRFLVSDNDEKGTAFARTYTASGRAEAGWTRTEVDFSRSVAARLADKASRKVGKTYDQAVEYLTE